MSNASTRLLATDVERRIGFGVSDAVPDQRNRRISAFRAVAGAALSQTGNAGGSGMSIPPLPEVPAMNEESAEWKGSSAAAAISLHKVKTVAASVLRSPSSPG